MSGFGLDHLPYGVFSVAGGPRRVGVRYEDDARWVLDLLRRDRPAGVRRPVAQRLHGARHARCGGRPATRSARSPRAAATRSRSTRSTLHLPDRGRRLRRLLRLARPRHQRREDVPPRRRGAHAQLAAPPDRLPRPRGHGRRLRHAGDPSLGPAQGSDGCGADVRPEPAARHRGRARLRRRRAVAAGRAGAVHRPRRPRLRRHRAQRLVRPGHPGLGVRPARAVPRQVVRHLDLARGSRRSPPSRRPGSTCPGRTRSRSPTSAPAPPAASTSTSRSS